MALESANPPPENILTHGDDKSVADPVDLEDGEIEEEEAQVEKVQEVPQKNAPKESEKASHKSASRDLNKNSSTSYGRSSSVRKHSDRNDVLSRRRIDRLMQDSPEPEDDWASNIEKAIKAAIIKEGGILKEPATEKKDKAVAEKKEKPAVEKEKKENEEHVPENVDNKDSKVKAIKDNKDNKDSKERHRKRKKKIKDGDEQNEDKESKKHKKIISEEKVEEKPIPPPPRKVLLPTPPFPPKILHNEETETNEDEEFLYVRGASPLAREGSPHSDEFDEHMDQEEHGSWYGSEEEEDERPRRRRDDMRRRSRTVRGRRPLRGESVRGKRGLGSRYSRSRDKESTACVFYLQGKCSKGDDCPFMHEQDEPQTRKMELCKFYLMDCCAKKDKCLYMHSEFPCKFYHTGMKCYAGDECKFSHGHLSEALRSVLLKHIETAPKEILGDFPRIGREGAAAIVSGRKSSSGSSSSRHKNNQKNIPSLFDIQVPLPVQIMAEKIGRDSERDQDENWSRKSTPIPESDVEDDDNSWASPPQAEKPVKKKKSRRKDSDGEAGRSHKHSSRTGEEYEKGGRKQSRKKHKSSKRSSETDDQHISMSSEEEEKKRKRKEKSKRKRKDRERNRDDERPRKRHATSRDVEGRSEKIRRNEEVEEEEYYEEQELHVENTGDLAIDINDGFNIPLHLPKKQRELFLRIQQQQREAVELQVQEEEEAAQEQEEDWYSSDEESPSITNVLKTLAEEPSQSDNSSQAPPISQEQTPVQEHSALQNPVFGKLSMEDISKIDISESVSKLLSSIRQSVTVNNDTTTDNQQFQPSKDESSRYPTDDSSRYPTDDSSRYPVDDPSRYPMDDPSRYPMDDPSRYPMDDPSRYPMDDPSRYSIDDPSRYPMDDPSRYPMDDSSRYPMDDSSRYPMNGSSRYPVDDSTRSYYQNQLMPGPMPSMMPPTMSSMMPTSMSSMMPTSMMPFPMSDMMSAPVPTICSSSVSAMIPSTMPGMVPSATSSMPQRDPRLSSRDPRSRIPAVTTAAAIPVVSAATTNALISPTSGEVKKQDSRATVGSTRRNSNTPSIYSNAIVSQSGDVDLRNFPTVSKMSGNKGIQLGADVDFRFGTSPFRDLDLRVESKSDIDLRNILGLPFKPALHTPATEINASLMSHPAIPWKLIEVTIPRPDFSKLKVDTSDPQYYNDPRIQKIFKLTPPAAAPANPTTSIARNDPRRQSGRAFNDSVDNKPPAGGNFLLETIQKAMQSSMGPNFVTSNSNFMTPGPNLRPGLLPTPTFQDLQGNVNLNMPGNYGNTGFCPPTPRFEDNDESDSETTESYQGNWNQPNQNYNNFMADSRSYTPPL